MTIAAANEINAVTVEIAHTLAEALYEHWRSSDYELKRQPAYKDATATLQRVFADQAAALVPVVETIVKNAVADSNV